MATIERDLGALEARMEAVEQEVQAMRRDVREIRDAVVTARGGWKVATVVIGLSASMGAVLGKLLPLVAGMRL